MLPAMLWIAPRPDAGQAWIDVLDVGQGSAVVVRTAEHTLLYDAGPFYSSQSDAGQRVVVPYLRATGVRQIDAMVISHRDKDHSGGVAAVQGSVPIIRTLSSLPELDGEKCAAGQSWQWDGVHFDVLHPQAADYAAEDAAKSSRTTTNRMSCVLKVSTEKQSVLLTGDIEAREEKAIIERSPSLVRSDVLLVPHHGARASSSPEFIEAVGAREIVFSAGYRNAFNHPRPEVLARYSAGRHWRTDRDGAIRIVVAGTSDVSAWRAEHPLARILRPAQQQELTSRVEYQGANSRGHVGEQGKAALVTNDRFVAFAAQACLAAAGAEVEVVQRLHAMPRPPVA